MRLLQLVTLALLVTAARADILAELTVTCASQDCSAIQAVPFFFDSGQSFFSLVSPRSLTGGIVLAAEGSGPVHFSLTEVIPLDSIDLMVTGASGPGHIIGI